MIPYCQQLAHQFKTNAQKLCLVDQQGNNLTFAQVDHLTGQVYSYFRNHGIKKGDFVFINLKRSALVYVVALGAIRAGAAFTVLEASAPPERIEYIRKDFGSKLTIDQECWEKIIQEEYLDEWEVCADTDPLCAIYTSGTTGTPKGTLHLRGMLDRNNEAFNYRGNFLVSDAPNFAVVFPLNFVAFEISTSLTYYGATLFILDYQTIKTPHLLYDYFEENRIECTFMTPSLFKTFKKKLSIYIRSIFIGGEVAVDIEKISIPVYNFFGMGEMGHLLATFLIDGRRGTVPIGYPTLPDMFFIKDEEICIKNPYAAGYINLPEMTKEKFRDGLFHTGDLGKILPDGTIIHLGRLDRMIKINGNRVEPDEILSVLKQTDKSAWFAVRGFEKKNTTFICAYYTGPACFDANQLRHELEARLPEYMIPAFFIYMEKVPIAASGKIDFNALPEPDLAEYRAPYAAPVTEMEKALCRSFGHSMGIEPFGLDDDFVLLGADSIAVAEAAAECNLTGVSFDDVYSLHTPRQIAQYLSKNR